MIYIQSGTMINRVGDSKMNFIYFTLGLGQVLLAAATIVVISGSAYYAIKEYLNSKKKKKGE